MERGTDTAWSPLHWAARSQSPALMRCLLQGKADVNAKTTVNCVTPLQCAVYYGNTSGVELLLKAKADPRATTAQGESVLDLLRELGPLPSLERTLRLAGARDAKDSRTKTAKGNRAAQKGDRRLNHSREDVISGRVDGNDALMVKRHSEAETESRCVMLPFSTRERRSKDARRRDFLLVQHV